MKITDFYKKVDDSVAVAKIIFNHLRKNYEEKKIAEIAKTTSGGTPSRGNPEYYGGEIPWLKSGGLNDGLITEKEEFITDLGLKKSSAKLFPKGTLLVAMYGATAGKVGILDYESATNQAVCAIFQKNEVVERDYLFWFLRQHRLDFINQSSGGAQPNISQKVIKATVLPVPPKKVQLQIIHFLSKLEEKKTIDSSFINSNIEAQIVSFHQHQKTNKFLEKSFQKQNQLLTQLRQAILQEAVQGKLVPQNSNDEPADELLQRIKAEKAALVKAKKIRKEKPLQPIEADEIPFELPKGWVWCRLGEISIILGGIQKTPKRNPIKQIYPYLRVANVLRNKLKLDEIKYFELFKGDLERWRLELNDLLVVEGNGSKEEIGRGAIWNGEIENCVHQNHIIRCRFLIRKISHYILHYINSPTGKKIMKKRSVTTTGLFTLSVGKIRNIIIPLPPISEQHRIVAKVESLLKLCGDLSKQVGQSRSDAEILMQAVLQEAFGK